SLNSAAVRLQESVGRRAVRDTAHSMGWPRKLNSGPSLALGVDAVSPLELAGAYVPFANGGFRVEPRVIDRIETTDGDVLYQRPGAVLAQAAGLDAIEKVNEMMRAVSIWGTGRAAAVPGYEVAGKTGTTQDNRDGWFAGHAGGMACIVWVGRDDNAPMPDVTGGRAPAIIWREVMARVLPPRYAAPVVAPLLDVGPDPSETIGAQERDAIADLLAAEG
ncbi:MAG: penicillin-binding transpeptidase domain-containing protein, partial [Hyphococcus sp.]